MNSLYGPIFTDKPENCENDDNKDLDTPIETIKYFLTYDSYDNHNFAQNDDDNSVLTFEAEEIDNIIAKVKELLKTGYRVLKIAKRNIPEKNLI